MNEDSRYTSSVKLQKESSTPSHLESSLVRQRSPEMSISIPITFSPESIVPHRSSDHFIFNSRELNCSLQSIPSPKIEEMMLPSNAMDMLQNMMNILVDNQDDVIPTLHEVDTSEQSSHTGEVSEEEGGQDVFLSPEIELQQPTDKDEKDEMEMQPVSQDSEAKNTDEESSDAGRRGSVHLTKDLLKKDSGDEPYKINIPLRKKVNQSTKKKLWREIERRKPFITQNVASHIQKYAKPPFITWGCKACEFPYEIRSYSKEYWQS